MFHFSYWVLIDYWVLQLLSKVRYLFIQKLDGLAIMCLQKLIVKAGPLIGGQKFAIYLLLCINLLFAIHRASEGSLSCKPRWHLESLGTTKLNRH
jgi:hypothetical protein